MKALNLSQTSETIWCTTETEWEYKFLCNPCKETLKQYVNFKCQRKS